MDQELNSDQRQEALLAQLELSDERRMMAANHAQIYRKRIARFYQKRVLERKFQIGELVLKRIMVKASGPRSKLQENWEGPFVIKEAYPGNAYTLIDSEGYELPYLWNGIFLKKFYP